MPSSTGYCHSDRPLTVSAVLILVACLSQGCGKPAEQVTAEDAAIQAKAASAAKAELETDRKNFEAIARGAPPSIADIQPATEQKPMVAAQAPSQGKGERGAIFEAPEKARLLAAFRDHLKDPPSANFRNIKEGSVHWTKHADTYGICGEFNAKNSYGGYNGFHGFVALVDDEGSDFFAVENPTEEAGTVVFDVFARNIGCRHAIPN